jgi:nicotinamide-nucleotide amidase
MWHAEVRPALLSLLGDKVGIIRHRTIRCFGAGESDVERMLPDLVRRGRVPSVGITASRATISLRITAAGATPEACDALIEPTAETIYQCLGDLIFGEDDDQLQDVVIRQLGERGQSLSAFDCDTGGLLAGWLSAADPEKKVYRGALEIRHHESAASVLGVGDQTWSFESAPVEQIASRCRQLFGTDCVLAIGPFPPPEDIATAARDVRIAFAHPAGVTSLTTPFAGHPDVVVPRIVKSALNFVRLQLLSSR